MRGVPFVWRLARSQADPPVPRLSRGHPGRSYDRSIGLAPAVDGDSERKAAIDGLLRTILTLFSYQSQYLIPSRLPCGIAYHSVLIKSSPPIPLRSRPAYTHSFTRTLCLTSSQGTVGWEMEACRFCQSGLCVCVLAFLPRSPRNVTSSPLDSGCLSTITRRKGHGSHLLLR